MNKDIVIRKMRREELDIAVDWAANEGWNPGLHDAEIFWKTDPDGYVAVEKEGEMIGSGSIVSYNGRYGFMGFFILKPEYRGKGLGTELWFYRRDKLISRLEKGAAIGMDGVSNMQPFYTRGGFNFSHRDLRMESRGIKRDFSDKVSEIGPEDFREINLLDEECFGFPREVFLAGWLSMRDSKAMKYVEQGKITGYGIIRRCQIGHKIGPLFAENYKVADELFKALSVSAAGELVYLDIPEINADAKRLAEIYDMKECFGCARMYNGSAPKLPYRKIFGVTTFELG